MHSRLMVGLVFASCAFGQAVSSGPQVMIRLADPAEFTTLNMKAVSGGTKETIAGAPYSAQATTVRFQVLADGNRIQQSTSGSVARDSQGRLRRDQGLAGLLSGSGEAPHFVMIDDPVAQVHWTLNAETKTAIKMQLAGSKGVSAALGVPPLINTGAKTWFYSSMAPGGIAAGKVQVINLNAATDEANTSEIDLGTQTVEGVPAQGKRITRTIPAGQVGNEQPIVITTETWFSPDLKVLVMSKSTDPRIGETTYKLTNIQRTEPAASLFQVPGDYTLKDQPEPLVKMEATKKDE